jgi:hypothetical protein
MSRWSFDQFSEIVAKKTDYVVVLGRPYAGSDIVSGIFVKQLGYKLIDMAAIREQVRKKLGTEEEPFEGEVPIDKVEQAVLDLISDD